MHDDHLRYPDAYEAFERQRRIRYYVLLAELVVIVVGTIAGLIALLMHLGA